MVSRRVATVACDCVLLDLIALVRAILPFGFGPNMMQSRVTLLAKTPTPKTINDARPITILSSLYRLVSKIVFKQVTRAWIKVLPPQISGGLPCRGVRDLAFEQAHKIEQHVQAKLPLGGSSIDLVKAFNLIPRYPLAKIFSRLGIKSELIAFWKLNLSRLTRTPVLQQTYGPQMGSTSGIPEGDAWSVLGMLALSSYFYFTLIEIRIQPFCFADNWSWMTASARKNFQAWVKVLNLVSGLRMKIDFQKTWWWATTKQLKNEYECVDLLFPDGIKRIHCKDAAKDLGEVLVYSKKAYSRPLIDRVNEACEMIRRLEWIPISLEEKALRIQTCAFPLGLYGADTHFLGKDHFHKLRKSVSRALGGDHNMSSPWLTTSATCKMLKDPLLLTICSAVFVLHRLALHDRSKADEAFQAIHRFRGKSAYGPISSIALYLRNLGWEVSQDGVASQQHCPKFHIGCDSPKNIRRCLVEAWDLFAISQVEHRRGFHGQPIDCHLTRSVFSGLSPSDQKLILLNVIGGFQTQVIKAKWCHTEKVECPLCNAVDNQQHRFLECTALADVRSIHPEAIGILQNDRPQWIYHVLAQKYPQSDVILRVLSSIPPVRNDDVELPSFSHLRFYTDGACSNPTIPHLRVSSWSIVCDFTCDEAQRISVAQALSDLHMQNQWLQCVLTGITSGFQSAARGELTAVVETCKLANGVATCEQVTIVTDAQYVINVVAIIRLGLVEVLIHKMANPDLVIQLRDLLNIKQYHFVKITSHRCFHDASSWLDLWDILGNHFADLAATAARERLPSDLKHMIQDARDFHNKEHKRLVTVMEYLIDLNKVRADCCAEHEKAQRQGQIPSSDNPLDEVLGEELVEVLANYMPTQISHLDFPPLTADIAQCFLQGSHIAYYLHSWLKLLVWPSQDVCHEPPASWGISFLELVYNFVLCTHQAFPIKISGGGSSAVYLPYFHDEALLQPLSKRTMAAQTFSMHQAVLALETLLQSKVFPTMPTKGMLHDEKIEFQRGCIGNFNSTRAAKSS